VSASDPHATLDDASFPLVIHFASGSSLLRERDLVSDLPILRNGPAGTFVRFKSGLKVSLPTDQIVGMEETGDTARVAFGGMQFVGCVDDRLQFARVRELHPEDHLSPDRSHLMILETPWVTSIVVDGRTVWAG